MAYYFYLGKTLLPVAPQKLQLKIKGANKTYTLINDGEINVLKTPGLTDIEFDALLPNVKYPFAVYKNGFTRSKTFLEVLKKYKQDKETFQFIVTRTLPNGKMLFDTNMKVSLESYTIKEDAKNYGMDVMVTIKLKQYRDFATKTCNIKFASSKPKIVPQPVRAAENPPKPANQTYTVVRGDCLWNIAKKYYGNGSKYTVIYNANRDKIKNPNLIYPGQVLTIPAA